MRGSANDGHVGVHEIGRRDELSLWSRRAADENGAHRARKHCAREVAGDLRSPVGAAAENEERCLALSCCAAELVGGDPDPDANRGGWKRDAGRELRPFLHSALRDPQALSSCCEVHHVPTILPSSVRTHRADHMNYAELDFETSRQRVGSSKCDCRRCVE